MSRLTSARAIARFSLTAGVALGLATSAASGNDSASDRVGYYGLGKPATEYEIQGWDIDVRPDGLGLPVGRGSVGEGEVIYQRECSYCHGVFGEGQGRWPVLAGGYPEDLTEERPEKTVGSYWPYASTLWDYIHRAMPFYNPQSLTDDQVYAVTAYVLYLNDIVDEDFVATQENLARVEMPNSDGFYFDDRPDVQNELCMENCRDPEAIEITWDSTELGVTPVAHLQEEAELEQVAMAEKQPEANAAGEEVYNRACGVCHNAGVAGAPAIGNKEAWLNRITQGMETLVSHAINGYRGDAGYMPPKGGNAALTDDEVAAAVSFMVDASQADNTQL